MSRKKLAIKDIFADESLQARSQMSEQTIIEYAERMKEGDKFPALEVFYDGERYYLSDGYHRYMAAIYIEQTHFDCTIKEGSLRDAILAACSANTTHGLKRTNADKRKAVERLIYDAEWQKWADAEIARVCSVSQSFVRGLRIDAEALGQKMPDKIQYKRRDGQIIERWATNYEVVNLPIVDLTVKSETTNGHVDTQTLLDQYGEDNSQAYLASDNSEWYTPAWVIDLVIEVLGNIDLDPCANSHDNPNVPARTHYTIEDDGLTKDWHGTVFMNPPYGGQAGAFYAKLLEQIALGHVTEAITLSNARTDTKAFHTLKDYPICFMQGRIDFINGETGQPERSSTVMPMFVYFGKYPQRFAEVFGRIGNIRITYMERNGV